MFWVALAIAMLGTNQRNNIGKHKTLAKFFITKLSLLNDCCEEGFPHVSQAIRGQGACLGLYDFCLKLCNFEINRLYWESFSVRT
jgi:hypothetical protein